MPDTLARLGRHRFSMHEAARVHASIELFSSCFTTWGTARPLPADVLLNRYFKERRYIGSKDRGAIASFFYLAIRHYAFLRWHMGQHCMEGERATAIAALLLLQNRPLSDIRNLFNGERFSPERLSAHEEGFIATLAKQKTHTAGLPDYARYNYPQWLEDAIKQSLGNEWKEALAALAQEAPVDLRANTLLTDRERLLAALQDEGFSVEPCKLSPLGVRMRERAPVFTSRCFKEGWFEMQDEGSQLVAFMLDAKPGEKIIDFCAGAGGKTLAIAAQMRNKGRILAWDTSQKRLEQMRERLKRARVDNVQMHTLTSERDSFLKRHLDSADAVIIDAPCSGSGTWRRNPDLKWRFTPQDLEEIMAAQRSILESASRLVKPGGRLLYITCSILQSENERALEAFLSQRKNFRVVTADNLCSNFVHGSKMQEGVLRLTPHKDGTDGFFAALLRRLE